MNIRQQVKNILADIYSDADTIHAIEVYITGMLHFYEQGHGDYAQKAMNEYLIKELEIEL